jgi:hypothetical protein
MKSLGLPTWATTLLGLLAGALAILNEVAFGFDAEWRGYLSIVLIFLSGVGISPLVGPAFRAALHLSTTASMFITSALAALALAVHSVNISEGWRGVIQGVLAFAAAVGFAPTVTTEQAKRLVATTGATMMTLVVSLWAVGALVVVAVTVVVLG